jgi:tRNA threonylcarbamoyladenosine biosynthesis protein TsaE
MPTPSLTPNADVTNLPAGWVRYASWDAATDSATSTLAERMASRTSAGDTILLQGDLGTGKTHFARAFIRARLAPEDRGEDIPSPSFTLVQTYEGETVEIWHADLYRLTDPQEVLELGLDAAMETAICLIEWPDRWTDPWPDATVCVWLSVPDDAPEARLVELFAAPDSALAGRLQTVSLA